MKLPLKLHKKLTDRIENNSLRFLGTRNELVDFSSNDYLGLAKSEELFFQAHEYLVSNGYVQNGATGSRLLSGNHPLYSETENYLKEVHCSEAGLLFNSGYDANIGFFSAVPQRNDVVLYDELVHASIRDGLKLSNAKSYAFAHNDLEALEKRLIKFKGENTDDVYVVTESVFSMDGDSPDLQGMMELCEKHKAYLIVDEAHALGVFQYGLVQEMNLEQQVFARIVTFGKALGCHGAIVLGSQDLITYLINFSRSLIYTTGLSPHALATIKVAYEVLQRLFDEPLIIHQKIAYFKEVVQSLNIEKKFVGSQSAIQSFLISGNENVKRLSQNFKENGFDVKPILSPTVPKGEERLRFCLHSYNSKEEIDKVLHLLSTFAGNER